ncbi:4Fe-4S binding protein [Sporomusa acidovorans]|uniref:4Fe-4S ferredoxin-type domain-containing protein n=1 Tax=Sporomusa acidovorans (strain ATCC 49682 / DSM 3132 / Mol) TaxID=1123286 RepID=A0ABZ3IZ43_SPOA4|nr:4Fe-4S dicluster domain-containing protein [Sporomusa acidovorans]OZC16848.1 anaerobic sulfite reductase subunit C [Sporomusa acidovorans DSM 3132]SDF24310.1 Dissimilatory sulfite reductase (desulfoviridin), alpha and beta subunits [Sporomusa acidovorans]
MSALTISAEDEKRVKALGFLSNKGTDNFSARVVTVNGVITGAQAKCIAEAAELFGNGMLTFTTRLSIECQGIPYEKIEDFRSYIAKEGLVTGGTGAKIRPVVSCKGTTCQYGRIDTFALSREIHERFYNGFAGVKLPHKFKIAVGGCPNNCVKPDLNDIGIIGQMAPIFDKAVCKGCNKCAVAEACPVNAATVVDGVLEIDPHKCKKCGRCIGKCRFDAIQDGKQGYKICFGGRWGKNVAQGKALNKTFADKGEVLTVIEKAILFYKEKGKAGERFSQTIERLGFKNVEAEVLSAEILDRKQEILEC